MKKISERMRRGDVDSVGKRSHLNAREINLEGFAPHRS